MHSEFSDSHAWIFRDPHSSRPVLHMNKIRTYVPVWSFSTDLIDVTHTPPLTPEIADPWH